MINGDHPTLADVQQLFPDAVLLPVETGTKKPIRSKWQKTTFADTQKEGYQRLLSHATTIGVLLGPPSNWLAVLDCDTEPFLDFMLNGNAVLQQTLRTRGVRAGGIWFRNLNRDLKGLYPFTVEKSSPLAVGGKIDPKTGLVKIGELRCGNCQSIICGMHPIGVRYQWLSKLSIVGFDPSL
jgi:bifunctional DNA primase/polymerase-like protein